MPFSDEDAVRNIAIIVARKSDYLRALRKSLPRAELQQLGQSEKAAVDEMLLRVIAALKPSLFLSRGEVQARTLNPDTRLEDIGQDRILKAIHSQLVT